jgi:hypothetical protein
MARSVLLALALTTLLLSLSTAQFVPYAGALSRGTYGAAGNLAASAYQQQAAKQAAQQSQAADYATGQKASAAAFNNANAAAWGNSGYEQKVRQQLAEVIDYCEGYVCTEWLDEYGSAYVNQGSRAGRDASGYGAQAYDSRQAAAADRAQYAAANRNQFAAQEGAQAAGASGFQGYGNAFGAGQVGWGGGWGGGVGFYGAAPLGYGVGGLSGAQAANLGVNEKATQFNNAYGSAASAAKANEAAGGYANAAESAAAQAKVAAGAHEAQYAKAFSENALSQLKNYGRKCRRYQCYHRYFDGESYSYGPNYYTNAGQAANQAAGQDVHSAGYGRQQAAGQGSAFAANDARASQFGAENQGVGQAVSGAGGWGW